MKYTLKKAAKMFMRLDKKIFKSEIRKAEINLSLRFNNSKKYMGLFCGYYVEKGKCGELILSKWFMKNKDTFKSTVIHEMVHCIQFIRNKPVNHKGLFKSESRRIKKQFGIDIL